MREIVCYFAKKIKGDDFNLDYNIPISYIIMKSCEMIIKLIRGKLKTLFVKNKGNLIFIGKNTKLKCKNQITIGNKVNIGNNVVIDALSECGVQIGDNVKLGDFTSIICTGSLKNIGKGIKIGKNTTFGEYCYFGAAGGIEIGEDVVAGQYIRFHSENHVFSDINKLIRLQGVTRKGIRIGNNCWIGSGVVFLDGVTVGDGCVIGANTLVNKNIPNNSVVVGNPCRILKIR